MGTISLSIPQVGQPDSTEDPKVANNFTTLQTWANGNIDASNISSNAGFLKLGYRQMNASAAAASGDWVVAGPSVTVTLPAPAQNAIVAVSANASVTATTPAVVSGTNIYGAGLSAAASFKLGVPLASVILESDGSSWAIIAGEQDTGWVDIASLGTNVAQGTQHAQTRLRGDRVHTRGYLTATNSVSGTVCTFPSGQRPPVTAYALVGVDSGSSVGAYVATISTLGVLTLSGTFGIGYKLYVTMPPISVT